MKSSTTKSNRSENSQGNITSNTNTNDNADKLPSRRTIIQSLGAGLTAGSLAGCGGNGNGSTSGTDAGLDGGPLAGKEIDIGVLVPAPDTFTYGIAIKNAAKMAEDFINKTGGLAGAEVNFIIRDTEQSPSKGAQAFRKFVNIDGVDVVTGGLYDQVVLQCFEPMRNNKMPFFSAPNFGNRQIKLVGERYDEFKYHFRSLPTGDGLFDTTLEMVRHGSENWGWDRVGLMVEDLSFLDTIWEGWRTGLEEHVEVPIKKRPAAGLSNWSPLYDQLEEENVDLLLVGQWITGVSAVLQWHNQERQFELGGVQGNSAPQTFWEESDGKGRYIWNTMETSATAKSTEFTKPWVQHHYKRFGKWPNWASGWYWDAVQLLRWGTELAILEEGLNEFPDPDTWVKYMLQVEDIPRGHSFTVFPFFIGFNGPDHKYPHIPKWTCAKYCDNPMNQLTYFQWQINPKIAPDTGIQQTMWPEPTKRYPQAQYRYPHWIDYPDDHPANDEDAPGFQPPENPTVDDIPGEFEEPLVLDSPESIVDMYKDPWSN